MRLPERRMRDSGGHDVHGAILSCLRGAEFEALNQVKRMLQLELTGCLFGCHSSIPIEARMAS